MPETVIGAERRYGTAGDRRAHSRGGRRDGDSKRPWYVRRKFWLGIVSTMYLGWRRLVRRSRA
jgi:hypothetical protein